jgi:hypothetical protein
MIALYSDDELRTALSEAKRRTETAPKPALASRQMQAQDQGGNAAEAEAYYARLRLEAAHRWGLVR